MRGIFRSFCRLLLRGGAVVLLFLRKKTGNVAHRIYRGTVSGFLVHALGDHGVVFFIKIAENRFFQIVILRGIGGRGCDTLKICFQSVFHKTSVLFS